jgi:hypothetical protein
MMPYSWSLNLQTLFEFLDFPFLLWYDRAVRAKLAVLTVAKGIAFRCLFLF